ncbi:hypothetical protein GCM10022204_22860 [Microlunatus aurantiacus]|uniref:ARB-07466-like C-terminal domain-containing protein n=1 Tax=Microlunatus aurantiacus TaxID=446786 RepID=A0ABP7DHU4_9ACTN
MERTRSTQAERSDRSEDRPSLTPAGEKTAEKKKAAGQQRAKQQAAKKEKEKEKAAELDLTVVGSRYTTAALKLRTEPSKSAKFVDVVDEAEKIKITDTVREGYRLVVVSDKGRWVTDEYLSKKKPTESAAGVSDASCSKSADIESGLVSNGVKVYRAMCAAFPEVSSFGGRRSSNDLHGSGQAIDAMISGSAAGRRLADWLRDNASELGVSEVIHAQKIWTVRRSGEGWRGMSDRGSVSANHYDHVHVSVY